MADVPFEPPDDKQDCDRCGEDAWADYDAPPTWTCDGKLYCEKCYQIIMRERRERGTS